MNQQPHSQESVIEQLEHLKQSGQIRAYDLKTVADALGITQQTVRRWADLKQLKTVSNGFNTKRYVHLSELTRLAREQGWPIDVEVLLDAD